MPDFFFFFYIYLFPKPQILSSERAIINFPAILPALDG